MRLAILYPKLSLAKRTFLAFAVALLTWSGRGYAAYWNVFNIEGESQISAEFVTYATLSDMLNDTNRTGEILPSQPLFDANIIGGGADIIRDAVDVPEPGSLALLCMSLLGFGLLRVRSRWMGHGFSAGASIAACPKLITNAKQSTASPSLLLPGRQRRPDALQQGSRRGQRWIGS